MTKTSTLRILSLLVTGLSLSPQARAVIQDQYVPDEVLVRYKNTVSAASVQSFMRQDDLQYVATLYTARTQTHKPIYQVKIQLHETVPQVISRLQNNPDIELVQPNYIYRTTATSPNDTYYGQLWGLKNTGQILAPTSTAGPSFAVGEGNPGTSGRDLEMETAWDRITDCSSVIVAVIDTGIQYNHEDLSTNMWDGSGAGFPKHGYDFVNSDNDPMDDNGHGTHAAGTIGAVGNNGKGISGICWKAKLMALKALGADGTGTTAQIASAINWAVDKGADVLNMSLGATGNDPTLQAAIVHARDNDVVAISAAGNDGTDNSTDPFYPCNYRYSNTLCITALNQQYGLASFSNFSTAYVDMGAPGVNIVSPWIYGRTVILDDFSSGWTFTQTNSGWGKQTLSDGTNPIETLTAPANWNGTVNYANNSDGRAHKNFDLSSYPEAWLRFSLTYDLGSGDEVNVFIQEGVVDPIDAGTQVDSFTGADGYALTYNIAATCAGKTCSTGFQLATDGSGTSTGSILYNFSLVGFSSANNGYNVLKGTSMAAPHAAGLAAMIRAYNPNYTATDVIAALKGGGESVAALSTKTTTGKAIHGPGSLSFIQAPTGVSALPSL